MIVSVPEGAEKLVFMLGGKGTIGKAEYRNVKLIKL